MCSTVESSLPCPAHRKRNKILPPSKCGQIRTYDQPLNTQRYNGRKDKALNKDKLVRLDHNRYRRLDTMKESDRHQDNSRLVVTTIDSEDKRA